MIKVVKLLLFTTLLFFGCKSETNVPGIDDRNDNKLYDKIDEYFSTLKAIKKNSMV